MIRESEVTERFNALLMILEIMSHYSSFTAADREIIRVANRGLLGTDPYKRWRIELLTEEEQTDPTFVRRYYEGGTPTSLDGRKYPDGSCSCHTPGRKCNYGEPYNPFTNPYPVPSGNRMSK